MGVAGSLQRWGRLLFCLGIVSVIRLGALDEANSDGADNSNDCWTYGSREALQDNMISPRSCCVGSPCGGSWCWKPPEFTYHFCCGQPACGPMGIGEIQRALLVLSDLPSNVNSSTISRRAYTLAGEHLRALAQSFPGLRLEMRDDTPGYDKSCDCAVAFAAMAMLQPNGIHNEAVEAVTLEWFSQELIWSNLLRSGWAPLFSLFVRGSFRAGNRQRPLPAHDETSQCMGEARQVAEIGSFIDRVQACVQRGVPDMKAGGFSFDEFVSALHSVGAWDLIWQRLHADLETRRMGRRCSAVPRNELGVMQWDACQPWSYSPVANFSSPLPRRTNRDNPSRPGGGSKHPFASSAVCVLGAPRTVVETYRTIRRFVVDILRADVFVYVPFSDHMTYELELQLQGLGPAVTAIVAPDVDVDGMRKRFRAELLRPELEYLYLHTPGPFRSPLHGEMGTVMWSYFHQSICRRMVEAHERQRRRSYNWVIFARSDMHWTRAHPSESVMDPSFVHVPFGQDNSFFNHGSEKGLNDRHAAIPRHLVTDYLGRWEELSSGFSLLYLQRAAMKGELINAEQFLLMHLRAKETPVARFPPVSYLAMCVESPQCMHLFRATNLGKRKWVFSAKYYPELVEVVRTSYDEFHRKPKSHEWIWHPTKLYALGSGHTDPWELHSLEYACCLGRSGPVSCKAWDLLSRCQCVRS
eukprot:TRINITY_DN6804_c0_g2_i1.p1 TRINITY_DN6804_c0_g2~~TRINITY_DN6804_c0_g2_i1.p1  ORF type:complete len:695 (-),score=60.07 TRINITY_DN6804_c0_g2_i1:33-2117(-)